MTNPTNLSPKITLLTPQTSEESLGEVKLRSLSLYKKKWRNEAKVILMVGLPVAFTISTRIWQMLTDQAVLGKSLSKKKIIQFHYLFLWMKLIIFLDGSLFQQTIFWFEQVI